jgi:hypothetical protein
MLLSGGICSSLSAIDVIDAAIAEVTYASIPEDGVDGVCIHLKTPGKKPKIIINRDSADKAKIYAGT